MARIVLHTAISAALTLVTFYSSPGLAADRDNSGKQIKRFEFVAPKAPVAQFVPPKAQFVAPKAGRTGSGTITAQFVAPKAKKDGSSSSTITAQFVAPKAKKTETEVIAKADTPAKPLLLAPATTSTSVTIDQAAPAPKAVAEATPAETATPDAGVPCDATRGRACLCSRSGRATAMAPMPLLIPRTRRRLIRRRHL